MTDQTRMDQLTAGLPTKSAKIRVLDAAGYERAEIARYLGIKYQHVRNVLVQGPPKSQRQSARQQTTGRAEPEDGPTSNRHVKIKIGPGGRIVIPAWMREVMDVAEGDTLFGDLDQDGRLVLTSARAAMRRAQRLTRELIPGDDSLSASLIADRRQEAARESEDG